MPLYERAIAIWEAVRVSEHPKLAEALANKAELLTAQVRLAGFSRPWFLSTLAALPRNSTRCFWSRERICVQVDIDSFTADQGTGTRLAVRACRHCMLLRLPWAAGSGAARNWPAENPVLVRVLIAIKRFSLSLSPMSKFCEMLGVRKKDSMWAEYSESEGCFWKFRNVPDGRLVRVCFFALGISSGGAQRRAATPRESIGDPTKGFRGNSKDTIESHALLNQVRQPQTSEFLRTLTTGDDAYCSR